MITPRRIQPVAVLLAGCLALAACTSSGSSAPKTGRAPAGNAKLARAQALADEGNASALVPIRRTTKPSEGCTRPNYFATVGIGVAGRKLAADELAFFAQRTPLDQGHCSAFLFVFHSGQRTTGSNGYTAGAVIDDDKLLEVQVSGPAAGPYATYDYH